MSMRAAVSIVVTLGLVACGRSSAPAMSSGIFGSVTTGPTCPVEMQGSPCPPGVWTGEVRATDASGHPFDTRTDDRGNYALALEPGTYAVVPVTSAFPGSGKPASIVVVDGPARRVDLTVDTGIR